MNPEEERVRREMVHGALELLLNGQPMTRAELFKGAPESSRRFQRALIDRLVLQGIAENASGETGSPNIIIKLKDRGRLEKILEDTVEMTRIIWPGSVPPAIQSEPEQKDTEADLQFNGARPLPAPIAPQTKEELGNQEQLLSQLLVVMNAACQSIIYMREKIDALEKTINEDLAPKIKFLEEEWRGSNEK